MIQVKVFHFQVEFKDARGKKWYMDLLKDLMLLILINLLVGNVMLDTRIIIREPDGSTSKEVTVVLMNPLAT